MAPLLNIEEPPRVEPRGFALFALGFRPFYFLASVFAALSIPLWAIQFAGILPHPYLAGPVWHAHEMLFGFTLAVMVGFLFTAGRNWSNQPTPTGWKLAALAGLWIAARVLILTPFAAAAAIANILFPLLAAIALAIPLYKGKSKRNYFFVGLLLLMAAAAAAIHLSQLGYIHAPAWLGLRVALDVILVVIVVMAGRVVPMFTNNGVPGAAATRNARVDQVALGMVLVLLSLDILGLVRWPVTAVAAVAGVAHAWRWWLWQPWKTLRVPLVWVLHLAYAWIPVHLLLRALAELGWVNPSLAIHALTVGAAGGLIIGMMTRTAKGHTGRPLLADRHETTCYVLVALSAAVRVLVPLAVPAQAIHAVLGSAVLWSAGFGLHAVRYWPILSRPRIDGRPG
jgi:uncharacterized protein involved in response to NO